MLRECVVTDGVHVPGETSWIGRDDSARRGRPRARRAPRRRPRDRFIMSTAEMKPAERRTHDGSDVRTRIDQFLGETGLSARGAKVVPLTGDASDRRYFRVLLRNEPSQVLAVHPGAIEFDTLPVRQRVAAAQPRCRCRCRASSRTRDELGIIVAAGSRRRHAAGAPRRGVAGRACRALPPGRLVHRDAAAARGATSSRRTTFRTGLRSTSRS